MIENKLKAKIGPIINTYNTKHKDLYFILPFPRACLIRTKINISMVFIRKLMK